MLRVWVVEAPGGAVSRTIADWPRATLQGTSPSLEALPPSNAAAVDVVVVTLRTGEDPCAIAALSDTLGSVPVVIVTEGADSRADAVRRGAEDVVAPGQPEALRVAILKALARSRYRREARADTDALREQQRENQRLRREVHVDALTGVANRKALESHLAHAHEAAAELCVLFCDVDRFKVVNDLYGHLVGDEVLRTVASRLAHLVREDHDLVARYAGDEFVLVVHAGLEQAEALAARVRDVMAEPLRIGGHQLALSISVGVAQRRREHPDPTALLDEADAALYREKRRGRTVDPLADVDETARLRELWG